MIQRIGNKRGASLCALLLTVVLLAACGNSSNNNGQSASPAAAELASPSVSTSTESAAAESAAAPATRIYKDADGKEVEIPVDPKRIVVLEYLGEALAVGVKPIGAAAYLMDAFAGNVEGIEDVGVPVNLEKVAALKPDLIISFDGGSDREDRPQLEKIAPFVSIAWSGKVYDHLRAMGDIVGKKDQAEQWIKNYEAKAQAAKAQLAAVAPEGSTAVALGVFDKDFSVYEDRNIGYTLYHALGFVPPAKVKAYIEDGKDWGSEKISLEVLPEYAAADYLFVMLYGDQATVEKKYEDLKQTSMWKNLPAVKAGHVYVIGREWFYYDALTLEWELDETVKLLTAKSE